MVGKKDYARICSGQDHRNRTGDIAHQAAIIEYRHRAGISSTEVRGVSWYERERAEHQNEQQILLCDGHIPSIAGLILRIQGRFTLTTSLLCGKRQLPLKSHIIAKFFFYRFVWYNLARTMQAHSSEDITRLLRLWSEGDGEALSELAPLVYQELHRLARRCMVPERTGHTLQTTALVNEAFVRMVHWK